jgi:acyl carrier protein
MAEIVTPEEYLVTIRALLAEQTKRSMDEFNLDSTLADIDLDSLDVVKLAGAAERTFGVTISTQELMTAKTLGDIVVGLREKAVGSPKA